MPATEKTWRDVKLVHVIFGVSSLLMLVSTIWMFAADHAREWKDYQEKQSRIEAWTVSGRIQEQRTGEYAAREQKARDELAIARSSAIDLAAVGDFKDEVETEAKARGVDPPDFQRLDAELERLAQLAGAAQDARREAEQAANDAVRDLEAAQAAEAEGKPDAQDLRALADQAVSASREADRVREEAEQEAAGVRDGVLQRMRDIVRRARFREDNLARDKKFKAADQTATLSLLGIAIGEGQPQESTQSLQQKADGIKQELDSLTVQVEGATEHRKALEQILQAKRHPTTGERGITSVEDEAAKQLADVRAELDRLHAELKKRASWPARLGKTILGMPVLDAFDNTDRQIDQVWLPDITIDYNFSSVARFDRCISCHRAIDKTAPGSPVEPAFVQERPPFTVSLALPETAVASSPAAGDTESLLRAEYGLLLAGEGLVHRNDVTIEVVGRETPAAVAGLEMGDVVERIDEEQLLTRSQAVALLADNLDVRKPLKLTIRRGLPNPYSSHPRLDLYVGSLSPHKKEQMGCTICHDGQGSATAFKWASHTPDNPDEADQWRREHGWFDNHHWIFPMYAKRFAESSCLKCHHDVTELEPSERYPDPPAPKLMEGYHLVRSYGCFGCHEINGYDSPQKRVGPDLRTEPNYAAAAQAILAAEHAETPAPSGTEELSAGVSRASDERSQRPSGLTAQERDWAERLIAHPEDDAARRRLAEAISIDKQLAADPGSKTKPRFSAVTHRLADVIQDMETPGLLRKVGPSLRFLDSKVDFDFLYAWIRKPSDFRPTTHMPQFFGQWEHLDDSEKNFSYTDASDETRQVSDREFTARYENIEIRAMSDYLLGASQPFEYLSGPRQATAGASAERGKHLFQTRGCLACHEHGDFPGAKHDTSQQGPDLSRMGAKLATSKGAKWLYSWLRNPSGYHARTKMPNLFLEPIREGDQMTDPAADIAEFLLEGGEPWQPAEPVPPVELSDEEEKALYDLALEHLAKQYPRARAAEYLEQGIPQHLAGQVKGDDAALLGMTDETRIAKRLEFVGRRTISKYGCAGCHDIPGFEDAKPIGTALADWGRKETSQLAFELIGQYLAKHGVDEEASAHAADGAHHGLDPSSHGPDTGYFLQALEHHNRQGFLWQKLRQPRSYDYEKTDNKGYNERLRMPKFPLNAQQREAVMTFILGLVSEPPATKYVYQGSPRQQAVVQGRQVLDKYNCAGCHALEMERWEFDYHENDFNPPPPITDYPFLDEHFTPDEVNRSLATDRRGMRHAVVHGRPMANQETGRPVLLDEDGVPLEEGDNVEAFYSFELWRPTLVNGEPRLVGVQNLPIRASGVQKYPAWGGALADYLFPVVIADEKQRNPQVNGGEAWGWLPPPLIGEGKKVKSDWMHDFLLDPYPIRPAVVLRMPKFNMSSDEATKIANYFAAVDNADYPYQYDERTRQSHSGSVSQGEQKRLGQALNIVVDNNFCVKCHSVGDFVPTGSPTALAPNLDQVHRRLRGDYLRNWIANPKRILPYTGMPVNIPYKDEPPHFGGVSQELFPGTSIDQTHGVVDFLMNYDWYSKQQISIKPLVKPAAPGADADAEAQAQN